jgi:PAS domain S-box-containing protein
MKRLSSLTRIIVDLNDADLYTFLQTVKVVWQGGDRNRIVLAIGENTELCHQLKQEWSAVIKSNFNDYSNQNVLNCSNLKKIVPVKLVNKTNKLIASSNIISKNSPTQLIWEKIQQCREEEGIPLITFSGVEASLLVLSPGLNLWIQVASSIDIVNKKLTKKVSLIFEPKEIAELLRNPVLAARIPECTELTAQSLINDIILLQQLWLQLLPLVETAADGSGNGEFNMANSEWKELQRGKVANIRFSEPKPQRSSLEEDILFRESPVGILYMSLDGGILKANPAMSNLIGYTEAQLRRLDSRAISYPDDFADEMKFIRQLINSEMSGKSSLQKRFICRNGTIVWAEVTMFLRGELEAENSYFLVFVKDLSYILQAEKEIQERREREVLLSEIAATIRSTFNFPKILEIGVRKLQVALNADRVVAYQLQPDASGICISEAVKPAYKAIKGQRFPADCIPQRYLQAYSQGRLWHSIDVRTEELSECYRQMLEQMEVRSIMVAAIQQRKDNSVEFDQGKLWGLLIVHECRTPRQWTEDERQLVQAVANQMAIAFEQASLVQQLQAYTQELEERVKERTLTLKRSLQFEQLIRKLTVSLRQELKENQILQTAVEGLVTALEIDGCCAMLFQVGEDLLEVQYEYFKDVRLSNFINREVSLVGKRLPLAELPENCRAALLAGKSYKVLITPKINDEVIIRENIVLFSPIWDTQGLIGAIALLQSQPHHFTQDEILLIEQVASQCTLAIRHSRQLDLLETKNQELSTLNRVKAEIIANTSHELRTPLTAIMGFSSVLLEECFGNLNQKQKEYVERIYSSGQYLLELINDILDMSRIEAGRLELDLQIVFISEITESAVSLIRERAIAQGLSLEVEVANNLEYLVADPMRLKQILINLLTNAVKFTPKGSVGLRVYHSCDTINDCPTDKINFTVWDTGIGIAPSDQLKLFSPFSQIHTSLSRQFPGTGLGLAIARRLAELHGGTITLESHLGKGTSFTLQMPLIKL